jgi:hypothetical protein
LTQESFREKYNDQFAEQMGSVDELALVLLKGHLIIEGALDNILSLIFFHPEYLDDSRLRFASKVHIARAYCYREPKSTMWTMVLAINSLRNEIAHKLKSAKRDKKMAELRRSYISEASEAMAGKFKDAPDPIIANFACALVVGFLSEYERDLSTQRKITDGMHKARRAIEAAYAPPEIKK